MTTADTLDRGRESFERQAWADAFVQLSAANRETSLGPEDLERLATAAYLAGRDADSEEVWMSDPPTGVVWQVDPHRRRFTGSLAVSQGGPLAAAAGVVWAGGASRLVPLTGPNAGGDGPRLLDPMGTGSRALPPAPTPCGWQPRTRSTESTRAGSGDAGCRAPERRRR